MDSTLRSATKDVTIAGARAAGKGLWIQGVGRSGMILPISIAWLDGTS
jgi:hypothetical protein